ncbi:MAG: adenylate kinase family protein [Ferroplasma sp.]
MICITGIPCTGKTSICRILNENGIQCSGLDEIARQAGALSNGIVDIDSLKCYSIDSTIVESHYSHLLECDFVIILKDSEERIRKRMHARKYSEKKIEENLDAQRADIIYFEALEQLPSNHIFVVEASDRNISDIFEEVYGIILRINKKVN